MFFGGTAAAASIGLINSLGTLGGFVGPYMIGSTSGRAETSARGLYVVGGTLVVSAVTLVLYALHRSTAKTHRLNPKGLPDKCRKPPRQNRTYRIAVIPGDGIGREVVPEGVRVLRRPPPTFGFQLQLDEFDFASCDYYLKHGTMMPDDWKEPYRPPRRHLLRRRRLARQGARPHLALGIADPVPPRVRSVRQPPPRTADARRALPARRPQARRHRLLRRARKYRRRVLLHRRQNLPRHRARSRHPGDHHDPRRRRPHPQFRLRPRQIAARKNTSPPPPNPTESPSPCPTGTSASSR